MKSSAIKPGEVYAYEERVDIAYPKKATIIGLDVEYEVKRRWSDEMQKVRGIRATREAEHYEHPTRPDGLIEFTVTPRWVHSTWADWEVRKAQREAHEAEDARRMDARCATLRACRNALARHGIDAGSEPWRGSRYIELDGDACAALLALLATIPQPAVTS